MEVLVVGFWLLILIMFFFLVVKTGEYLTNPPSQVPEDKGTLTYGRRWDDWNWDLDEEYPGRPKRRWDDV